MAEKNNYYDSESIDSLEGAEPYRQRPATVLGTDDERGLMAGIHEIIANSADEAREGYGKRIITKVEEDGTITITDYGRGVPMGYNSKKKKYAYELIFCTMYGGGKLNGDSSYSSSEGLNGIGCTAAQFTSEFMEVVSCRDELVRDKNGNIVEGKFERKKYTMNFKEGYPIGKLKIEDTTEPTGTKIRFKPDKRVFKGAKSIIIPVEKYIDILRRKAMLMKGVEYVIQYMDKPEIKLLFENGISDFIDKNVNKPFLKSNVVVNGETTGYDDPNETGDKSKEYTAKVEVAFNFCRGDNFIEAYHNGANLIEGGSGLDGFRDAVCKVIKEAGVANGKFSRNEKVNYKDIEELIVCIVSTECPGYMTSFMHQTKTAINNRLINRLTSNVVYEEFSKWAMENKEDIDVIVNQVILNKTAREKADAVKKKAIKELTQKIDGMKGLPPKFQRCTCKDPSKTEVYIVEGDSAKGSIVLARNKEYQAVMPLRGKITNCLKENLETILNSDVIRSLLRIFGCGVEVKSKYIDDLPKFDISKLNFDKIIICTDADFDGFHIRCLVITMIYRLCPSLLKAGKVYIVETPLYEIKYGKEKIYAFDDAEKESIMKELRDKGIKENKINIKRMKGLGEADAPTMARTTMDPNNRRLIRVNYPDDDTEMKVLLNALMGDDIAGRKNIIEAYFDDTESYI